MKTWFSRGLHRWIVMLCLAFGVRQASAMEFQLVSTPNNTTPPSITVAGDSRSAVVSPNGRYVLFMSWANSLVQNIPLFYPANVFLRDRTNGTTTLVSVNLAGTGSGNGASFPVGISDDGRYALFESVASNLVAGDTNQVSDVFVRDMTGNTTLLVSTTGSSSGSGLSRDPAMTPDGRYVAFVSAATNLVATDTNRIADIFVRDLQSGTTVRASIGASSLNTNFSSSSESPGITPDGRYVVFSSTATNLVPGVTSTNDIYVRDLVAGTTLWASTNARTLISANIVCNNNKISADGQFVAFEAKASSSTQGFVLRHNLGTGQTDVIHTNAYFSDGGLDMTPDGRFVTFLANTNGNVCALLWDAQTGTNILVSGNVSNQVTPGTIVDSPSLDSSGARVAFVSNDPNQTTNQLAGRWHAYVRDVNAGTTMLVNADTNGAGAGVSIAAVPALSSDGRSVVFESASPGLVANDGNHSDDVFVRDITAAITELVSVRSPVTSSQTPFGISGVYDFSVSTNGRYVAFSSDAENDAPNTNNCQRNVFLRDLQAGTTVLVSADTNGVLPGNNCSSSPSVSADGRYVVFTSLANNLVAGDTNNASDVFIRDLLTGVTTIVSVDKTGLGVGNADSSSLSVSTDGRYVLFFSTATNLTAGSFSSGVRNLFFRDRVLNTNYALTTGGAVAGDMTPDGRFVLFVGSRGILRMFVFDSQSASIIFTNTANPLPWIAISPNGQYIAYSSNLSATALRIVDRVTNTNWSLTTGTNKNRAKPRFSADGRFLAYASDNGTQNIRVFDTQTGTNSLISRSFDPSGAANGDSYSPDISADGRFVSFASEASNIIPGDSNGTQDVFVYDRSTDAMMLLSVNQSNSAPANNRSRLPIFSGDGKTLVFASWASDLVGSDFNQTSDLFAYRLSPSAIVDSDGDGMDDQWELDKWGTLGQDGTGDFDGDGATDLFEFQTGTDPRNPASFFKGQILLAGTSGQNLTLSWPAFPGRSYGVQYKDDVTDSNWYDLQGNTTLLGAQGSLQITNSLSGHRFYRIFLRPATP